MKHVDKINDYEVRCINEDDDMLIPEHSMDMINRYGYSDYELPEIVKWFYLNENMEWKEIKWDVDRNFSVNEIYVEALTQDGDFICGGTYMNH